MYFIKQKTIHCVTWALGLQTEEDRQWLKIYFIAICDFVTPVLVEIVIFNGAFFSDNRIVFFRSKSFFKSDYAVGLARF